MEKLFIKNRKDQKVSVLIERNTGQKGLAFVMHGLGGFKKADHIEVFAQAFKDKGFTVIRFDTTNSYGESDGNYSDATTTNYYEDLEDVIAWAGEQKWYEEPFWLAGHSLGSLCIALYAENNPEKVKALAPISSVISGKLLKETYSPEELEEWKITGWQEKPSASIPGLIKRLKYDQFVDVQDYDLLQKVDRLTMPILLIVGEKDSGTPPKHQQMLYDAIPGDKKELYIIKDAPHTFRDESQLKEIKGLFLAWIEKNN